MVDSLHTLTKKYNSWELAKLKYRTQILHPYTKKLHKKVRELKYDNKLTDFDKIDMFLKYCTKYYGLSPLTALTFYYYCNVNVHYDDDLSEGLRKQVANDLYHNPNMSFCSIQNAMRWIISYRCAKMYIKNQIIRGINNDKE